MRRVQIKYHEAMFYFWYGRNGAMRDYHGKKYHQILSLPTVQVNSGINFRNYKQDVVIALQSMFIVASFVGFMLACVAQFG